MKKNLSFILYLSFLVSCQPLQLVGLGGIPGLGGGGGMPALGNVPGLNGLKGLGNVKGGMLLEEEFVLYTLYHPVDHKEEELLLPLKATFQELKEKASSFFLPEYDSLREHKDYVFDESFTFWYEGKKIQAEDYKELAKIVKKPEKKIYCLANDESDNKVWVKSSNAQVEFKSSEEKSLALLEKVVASERFGIPVSLESVRSNEDIFFTPTYLGAYLKKNTEEKKIIIRDIFTQKKISIEINDNTSVRKLKRVVALAFDVPLSELQLNFKGDPLQPGSKQDKLLKDAYSDFLMMSLLRLACL